MLEELCRLKHLQENNIADSYTQAKELEEKEGFPRGMMLGPNTRAWFVSEVNAWLKNRPTGPSSLIMERAAKSIEAKRTKAKARNAPSDSKFVFDPASDPHLTSLKCGGK
jgi:hypothetical protein